ncbi:hypothetical protein MA16_Dca017544 [Dendrobium catenatum]|uniref:Uncharacterized protein n=1 Tax=Dendrobium catenatum TaxID=906689 RepID=A0A2I0W1X5_9ASPA|nr:hypothetical protein MA16_Dca017544 [Dendrobium catenatum]
MMREDQEVEVLGEEEMSSLEPLLRRGNREKGERERFFMELKSLEVEDVEKIEASNMVQPLLQQYQEVF